MPSMHVASDAADQTSAGHSGPMRGPRVAIAHDYLTQRGGAERVVLALSTIFPDAPIYTTLYDPDGTYPEFRKLDIRPSWLNRVGVLRRSHRAALPLLPAASSSIQIDADVVIASSSGWAHGFRTTGKSLVYCYAPPRWLYESERYFGDDSGVLVRSALAALKPALKRWDRRAVQRSDRYLAISSVTQERIRRTYGREAAIVPAPHSVDLPEDFAPQRPESFGAPEGDYFLVVSRLLPYKNVMEIVQAFAMRPYHKLVIVGSGPDRSRLMGVAGQNVTFLEALSDEEMMSAYAGCQALVAASHEDFGLTPLEAAAHGKPVAVLRWGGFLDTVVEGTTGVFFDEPIPELIAEALDEVTSREWDQATLRGRAADFDEHRFADRINVEIRSLLGTN